MRQNEQTKNVDLMIDLDHYVGRTDERLVSFNLDWHKNDEEVGRIDISARTIEPVEKSGKCDASVKLRIGGSEGDVVCYDVPMYNSTCASMGGTIQLLFIGAFGKWQNYGDTKLELFGLNAVWGRKNHSLTEPLDMTNIHAFEVCFCE